MKFYCDKCQTKYSIADEKVRGKVLKIRCKRCEHIITVKEMTVPAAVQSSSTLNTPPDRQSSSHRRNAPRGRTSSPRPTAHKIAEQSSESEPLKVALSPQPRSEVQWHYALNGETYGPYPQSRLVEMFEAGQLGDEVYLWNESLANWKPARDVEPFRMVLAQRDMHRPRQKTLGFTGQIDAIDRAVLKQAQEPMPSSSSSATATDLNTVNAPVVDDDETILSVNIPREQSPLFSAQANNRSAQQSPETVPEPGSNITDGNPLQENQNIQSSDIESEFFERQQDYGRPSDTPSVDDIPFLTDAPNLQGSSQAPSHKKDDVSASLLMQMQSIARQGRGKKLIYAIVALVGLVLIVAVVYRNTIELNSDVADDQIDRHDQIANSLPGDNASQGALIDDGTTTDTSANSNAANSRLNTAANNDIAVNADINQLLNGASSELFEASMNDSKESAIGSRRTIRDTTGGRISGGRISSDSRVAVNKSGEIDRFQAMGSISAADRKRTIYSPSEALQAAKRQPATRGSSLTDEQAAQGLRNIRRSIGLCHERHLRYGIPLDAQKVYVTVEVEPSGRVSSYSAEPRTIRGTEFDKCMQSHRGRWRFAEFSGQNATIRAPFVIQ